ncbi:MAG: preprotein translocase subunit YajC [Planctomycetota bacterium]|jgi:preprotein translocase subunit YajC
MSLDHLILQTAGPLLAAGDGGSGSGWFIPMILVFLIFYFIVIRPGSRERKEREAQVAGLKKHDKVITNAGIHGTVVALEDDAVVLRVDEKNNVRIKFSRAAIWQVLSADQSSPIGEKTS